MKFAVTLSLALGQYAFVSGFRTWFANQTENRLWKYCNCLFTDSQEFQCSYLMI